MSMNVWHIYTHRAKRRLYNKTGPHDIAKLSSESNLFLRQIIPVRRFEENARRENKIDYKNENKIQYFHFLNIVVGARVSFERHRIIHIN